jgi:hypothetical protein
MASSVNPYQSAMFNRYTEPKTVAMFHRLRQAAEKADARANELLSKDWSTASELEKQRWFKTPEKTGQQGFADRAKKLGDHFLRMPYASIEGNQLYQQPDSGFRQNLYGYLSQRYANRGWALFKSDPINEPDISKSTLLNQAEQFFMGQAKATPAVQRLTQAMLTPDNKFRFSTQVKSFLEPHSQTYQQALPDIKQPLVKISLHNLASLAKARRQFEQVARYVKGLPDPALVQGIEQDLLSKQPWRNLPAEVKYYYDAAVFKMRNEYEKATGQPVKHVSVLIEPKALPEAAVKVDLKQQKPKDA